MAERPRKAAIGGSAIEVTTLFNSALVIAVVGVELAVHPTPRLKLRSEDTLKNVAVFHYL